MKTKMRQQRELHVTFHKAIRPSGAAGWRISWWEHAACYLTFSRKKDAVATGRAKAKRLKLELVVHNRDGRIAWRNSYGGDSPRRRG